LFESLQTLRGQAACERLLAMIAIDTDNIDNAEVHAARAERLYKEIESPWGLVESSLLLAQIALARREIDEARVWLEQSGETVVNEPEPKQHDLLTRSWLELETGEVDAAYDYLKRAQAVFPDPARVGDHVPHLLARLSRRIWPVPEALDLIDDWRASINNNAIRERE
jgi:hypothetical protein